MAKAAQSATAMWRIACQVRHEVGPGTFLKQFFFLQGCISKKNLLGQKSKLDQITMTIIIFKPKFYCRCCHECHHTTLYQETRECHDSRRGREQRNSYNMTI